MIILTIATVAIGFVISLIVKVYTKLNLNYLKENSEKKKETKMASKKIKKSKNNNSSLNVNNKNVQKVNISKETTLKKTKEELPDNNNVNILKMEENKREIKISNPFDVLNTQTMNDSIITLNNDNTESKMINSSEKANESSVKNEEVNNNDNDEYFENNILIKNKSINANQIETKTDSEEESGNLL